MPTVQVDRTRPLTIARQKSMAPLPAETHPLDDRRGGSSGSGANRMVERQSDARAVHVPRMIPVDPLTAELTGVTEIRSVIPSDQPRASESETEQIVTMTVPPVPSIYIPGVSPLAPPPSGTTMVRRKGQRRSDFIITKQRIKDYGETPDCLACMGCGRGTSHSDECYARIYRLWLADPNRPRRRAASALAVCEGGIPCACEK